MTVTPYSNHGFVELYVPDMQTTKNFYLKLGFKTVWEIESYLVMKFDHTVLSFNLDPTVQSPMGEPRLSLGRGVEIVVQVESMTIEKYYQQVVELGSVNIVEKLIRQDWNKTDFRILDNNGYYLRFTEPENILFP